MDRAAYEQLGLYDPEAPGAPQRLELLEWLATRGVTAEQMVAAAARGQGQLVALAGDLVRAGDGSHFTLAEMVAAAGVDPELASRALRAAGFPPPEPGAAPFLERDRELFRNLALAAETFGTEPTVQFIRVVGASLARIADAAHSLFLVNVEGPMREQTATPLELAQSQVVTSELARALDAVLATLFRLHFDEAIRRNRLAREPEVAIEAVRVAIVFVDLVGFTGLAHRLSTQELGRLASEFEAAAADLVASCDGRLVKVIGDEAMFAVVDAADACLVALGLCRWCDEHPLLEGARGAVAIGAVIGRDGDYYGPLVNLASRAVKLADPGAVLATAEVARAASSDRRLRFGAAGDRELRGFEQPVPLLTVALA